jgi:hypothetical protein
MTCEIIGALRGVGKSGYMNPASGADSGRIVVYGG